MKAGKPNLHIEAYSLETFAFRYRASHFATFREIVRVVSNNKMRLERVPADTTDLFGYVLTVSHNALFLYLGSLVHLDLPVAGYIML